MYNYIRVNYTDFNAIVERWVDMTIAEIRTETNTKYFLF